MLEIVLDIASIVGLVLIIFILFAGVVTTWRRKHYIRAIKSETERNRE